MSRDSISDNRELEFLLVMLKSKEARRKDSGQIQAIRYISICICNVHMKMGAFFCWPPSSSLLPSPLPLLLLSSIVDIVVAVIIIIITFNWLTEHNSEMRNMKPYLYGSQVTVCFAHLVYECVGSFVFSQKSNWFLLIRSFVCSFVRSGRLYDLLYVYCITIETWLLFSFSIWLVDRFWMDLFSISNYYRITH